MNINSLIKQIHQKKSFLCIGLDVDLEKIPTYLHTAKDPIFEFCKKIIDATHNYAVAYKPNIAFFEVYGANGIKSLEKVIAYLNEKYPQIFTIADAKRGDIGNTSQRYAQTYFETYNFDAITLSPYMGEDAIQPFLQYPDKYAILLALTSNRGANDFQKQKVGGEPLFKKVISTSQKWQNAKNLMYVVGATQTEYLKSIRKLVPKAFLLIPGLGQQGGDLEQVIRYGANENIGILVNASRSILYAAKDKNFEKAAKEQAQKIVLQMKKHFEI